MPQFLNSRLILLVTALVLMAACDAPAPSSGDPVGTTPEVAAKAVEQAPPAFAVDFERYQLDNGLTVILHVDRSDPVVAVALTAHVGSAREKAGRTGFAHLFEHLLFLESENLGKGGLDAMSARIGGSGANGSTSRDRTNYFQTVPNDALEKMLWAEADKLGWFINTVTEPVLAKEKQVVKNEKRAGVDNRPYGHTFYVIDKALYPEGHPYNWQVIGSLEDLQAAELEDVKEFFRAWYTPNNVTLALAGDFDVAQAKSWIEKYFGEIPSGPDIEPQPKQPASLSESRSLLWEDNFANLPRLSLTWPTVHRYHPDEHALNVLAQWLSEGKEAPLNAVLVDEKELAAEVAMFNYHSELAGAMNLFVTGFEGVSLDAINEGIDEAFRRFEHEGLSEQDLARIKAGRERAYYEQFDSVLGKAFTLAQYQIFAGDAAYAPEDLANLQSVSIEDVQRVYREYFKDRPRVATSFVPKGQAELALSGSMPAQVVEEAIVQGAEETFDASQAAEFERTPSSFDRTVEPVYGASPVIRTPEIWQTSLDNGVAVSGIVQDELPLVRFSLVMDGGQLLERSDRSGVANLLARSMLKGTANRTTAELENAIKALGASISVRAGQQVFRIDATTLASRFEDTLALMTEMLLEPRFDARELELLQLEVAAQLQAEASDPGAIANRAWAELVYGQDSPLARNILGTEATVSAMTAADLAEFHASALAAGNAALHVVGAVPQSRVERALTTLESSWTAGSVPVPEVDVPDRPDRASLVFIDVPGAKQSVLRIGYPALARTDDRFYPATMANYRLGGGSFASELTQQLREGKGYTYSIRSGFSGSHLPGPFQISSNVRTNVTLESLELIREILGGYAENFDEGDLQVTQDFLLKSQARAFETLNSKLGMLENISAYGWPHDYLQQRQAIIREMDVAGMRELSARYFDPDRMIYLVVGDAATQRDRLEAMGMGAARDLAADP